MFLLDPWWNPAVEAQAIDRAHRIGQIPPRVRLSSDRARHRRREGGRAAAEQARSSPTRSSTPTPASSGRCAPKTSKCSFPEAWGPLGGGTPLAGLLQVQWIRTTDVLKVDLHLHTAEDPVDYILHDAHQLIDRAAELGFDALAITLHDRQLADPSVFAYARERRIILLPGIERSIEGRHVVLINFPQGRRADPHVRRPPRPESAHPRHRHRAPPVLPAPHEPDVAPRGAVGAVRCGRMELLLDRRAQFQRAGGSLGGEVRQADRRQFRLTRSSPARPHVLAGLRRAGRRRHLPGDSRRPGVAPDLSRSQERARPGLDGHGSGETRTPREASRRRLELSKSTELFDTLS